MTGPEERHGPAPVGSVAAVPPDRPVVAFDVTPLLGFRTGLGLSTAEMWAALRDLDRPPTLRPFAIGLAGTPDPAEVPTPVSRIRLPTRALIAVWSRTDRLSMDHWLPATDVLHATNFAVGPTRRPTLLTIQDIGFAVHPETADAVTRTFPGMIRRALDRGAAVHVTTRYLAGEVDGFFGPGLVAAGRLHVVPLGIPDLGPAPTTLASTTLASTTLPPTGGPYVLALGSQEPRKNLPRLVRAFALVADELDDLRLVLAGPPGAGTPAVDATLATLPAAVRSRVVVTGPLNPAARRAVLSSAALLAYPSLYEGFGLPPLEAMSLGVPALVARAGALPEVAGPAAELVDPEDVDDLARGLRRLIVDSARRRQLIDDGRRHASQFTWATTAQGLATVYERLATSS